MSLISVLVAVAIAGGLAATVAQIASNGFASAKSTGVRNDLESIRTTIRGSLSCKSTLGITPATALPTTCPASLTLRRKDGTPLSFADWTLSTTCASGEVTVRLSRPGRDPLTNRPWNATPTSTAGDTISTDLFGGRSDFCREYLAPGTACSGASNITMGFGPSGPVCCRRVTQLATANPGKVAYAQCAPSEYLASGGGSCHDNETGVKIDSRYVYYMHRNFFDTPNNRWLTDCNAAAIPGSGAKGAIDTPAWAFAICCPRNG